MSSSESALHLNIRQPLIVGSGSMGKHLLNGIASEIPGWTIGMIDKDTPDLDSNGFTISDPGGILVDEVISALVPCMVDRPFTLSIAALGGETGYKACKALGKTAGVVDTALFGIFILPFKEENVRTHRASAQLGKLKKLFPNRIILRNSALANRTRGMPFYSHQHIVNTTVLNIVDLLDSYYTSGMMSKDGFGPDDDKENEETLLTTPAVDAILD